VPANLTPQYFEAEKAFRSAKTIEEKIEALEGMLSVMPKHKGTDHLRAELTAKIARFKEQLERAPGGARRHGGYHVRREGAGQVALVGLTNSGKSALVASLTGVSLRIADFPYVTREPSPAMMRYENVQIQLVDMPAVEYAEARAWLSSVLRSADLLLVTIDAGPDTLGRFKSTINALHQLRIAIEGDPEPYTGILTAWKKCLVAATKYDLPDAGERYRELREAYGRWLTVIPVSVLSQTNLDVLRAALYRALAVIRVYTKPPGQQASLTNPTILPVGSRVIDVAAAVHKDFVARVRFAQVWGSAKFPGQKVSKDYVLREGDIVELHV